jgi:hypothetical protein
MHIRTVMKSRCRQAIEAAKSGLGIRKPAMGPVERSFTSSKLEIKLLCLAL